MSNPIAPEPAAPPDLAAAREMLAAHPELAPMTAAAGLLTTLYGPAALALASVFANFTHQAKYDNSLFNLLLPLFWLLAALLALEHFIPRGLNLQQAAAEIQAQERDTQAAEPPAAAPRPQEEPPPPYY